MIFLFWKRRLFYQSHLDCCIPLHAMHVLAFKKKLLDKIPAQSLTQCLDSDTLCLGAWVKLLLSVAACLILTHCLCHNGILLVCAVLLDRLQWPAECWWGLTCEVWHHASGWPIGGLHQWGHWSPNDLLRVRPQPPPFTPLRPQFSRLYLLFFIYSNTFFSCHSLVEIESPFPPTSVGFSFNALLACWP